MISLPAIGTTPSAGVSSRKGAIVSPSTTGTQKLALHRPVRRLHAPPRRLVLAADLAPHQRRGGIVTQTAGGLALHDKESARQDRGAPLEPRPVRRRTRQGRDRRPRLGSPCQRLRRLLLGRVASRQCAGAARDLGRRRAGLVAARDQHAGGDREQRLHLLIEAPCRRDPDSDVAIVATPKSAESRAVQRRVRAARRRSRRRASGTARRSAPRTAPTSPAVSRDSRQPRGSCASWHRAAASSAPALRWR